MLPSSSKVPNASKLKDFLLCTAVATPSCVYFEKKIFIQEGEREKGKEWPECMHTTPLAAPSAAPLPLQSAPFASNRGALPSSFFPPEIRGDKAADPTQKGPKKIMR